MSLCVAFALLVPAPLLVPVASASVLPLPRCTYRDRLTSARSYDDWGYTLLDTIFRLPRSYAPVDLVPVRRAGIPGSGSVRRLVIRDLAAMTSAARAAHAPLAVQSAYRSYRTQVAVFATWARRLGFRQAIRGSARPGHSEHQLGTVIDFRSAGGGAPFMINGYDWAKSRAGAWMTRNAWRYGFVLSYPKGRSDRVCYGYEPWHYRYVGRAIARAIHVSGLTPRAWFWRHPAGLLAPTPSPVVTPTPDPTQAPPPTPTPSPVVTPTPDPTQAPPPTPTDGSGDSPGA